MMKRIFFTFITLFVIVFSLSVLFSCGESGEAPEHEHIYGDYISDKNATCTADGTETAKCTLCDKTDTVTDAGTAKGHAYGEAVFVWSGYSSAKAEFVCRNGCGHKETAEATLTSELTKESTITEHGIRLHTATAVFLGESYSDTSSELLALKQYLREEDRIYFGSYPQSQVENAELSLLLTELVGGLPTASDSGKWLSYGYYSGGSNDTDYMWYTDLSYEDDEYRGVYFTENRLGYAYDPDSKGNNFQGNNGYEAGEVYWFKYEPLAWRILTEEDGRALILSEMSIDSQEYYHGVADRTENGETVYANNYAFSNIRRWLNDSFYNTAFGDLQKQLIQLTAVDNGEGTVSGSENPYICEDTEDNVFLLSYSEVKNEAYGFGGTEDSNAAQMSVTDYAMCQGGYYRADSYTPFTYWWLRSPSASGSTNANVVTPGGIGVSYDCVYSTFRGVCPALWIIL